MYPLSPTCAITTLLIQIKEETTWGYPPEEVKNALCAVKANDQIRLDLCHNPTKRHILSQGKHKQEETLLLQDPRTQTAKFS